MPPEETSTTAEGRGAPPGSVATTPRMAPQTVSGAAADRRSAAMWASMGAWRFSERARPVPRSPAHADGGAAAGRGRREHHQRLALLGHPGAAVHLDRGAPRVA